MGMKTSEGARGYVASEPRLTFPEGKKARLWVRFAQTHSQSNEAGEWKTVRKTYHDLVQFGRSAERSFEMLRPGDNIIAIGTRKTYPHVVDGVEEEAEQFVATSIGHDINTSTYTVHRGRSPQQRHTQDRNPPTAAPGRAHQPPPPPPPPPEPVNR